MSWHGKQKTVVLSLVDYEQLLGLSSDIKVPLFNFPDDSFPQIDRKTDAERVAPL